MPRSMRSTRAKSSGKLSSTPVIFRAALQLKLGALGEKWWGRALVVIFVVVTSQNDLDLTGRLTEMFVYRYRFINSTTTITKHKHLPKFFPHVSQQGDIHIDVQVMKLSQGRDMERSA